MDTEICDILIIGGGLSGIFAAYTLCQENTSFAVLEARERIGGRIFCPIYQGFYSDLGPSWYWPEIHPKMAQLIQTLDLKGFRQFEEGLGRFQIHTGAVRTIGGYTMAPPSWRLFGGMTALISKLTQKLPKNVFRLNHPVCKIEKKNTGVLISVGELEQAPWASFYAEKVILAIPPRLAASTILFDPEPSHELTQAMLKIGTWMAGHAKFYALYEKPFWRESGLSGEGFSELGPLSEIHDGSNHRQGPYGLTGFLGMPAVQRTNQQQLIQDTLSQLAGMYGTPALRPASFFYKDWARERFTATRLDQAPMYEHPLYHPPAGQSVIWDNTLYFAGTETADRHGGYMEGALDAAERAVRLATYFDGPL